MAYISVKDVSIVFPGVKALDHVSFEVEKGEAVALCGENGAGKSTLAKILAGVYPRKDYEGEILINGEKTVFHSALDAEKRGVSIVHQEMNQIEDMTVAENICMSMMPTRYGLVDYERMNALAEERMKLVGLAISPDTKLRELSVSHRQMIEIAKALSQDPEILIFDEATSSLSSKEVQNLFEIMKQLKERGVTIFYVSHKLEEIFQCCDSIVVLKDGKFVKKSSVEGLTKGRIVTWMVGRELQDMYPPRKEQHPGEIAFEAKDWRAYDGDRKIIDGVSLNVRHGEILGIYGLMGAGRTELLESFYGCREYKIEGTLKINGVEKRIRSVSDAIQNGMALVTEERKRDGLILCHSARENMSLPSLPKRSRYGFLRLKEEEQDVNGMVERFHIKLPFIDFLVSKLSGGNQQKIVLSKWLLNQPEILMLDEPTRGIDVGAKAEIYKTLRQLADSGMAIIMVSSELPEIFGVSDRIVIMKEGRQTGEVSYEEATEELLVSYAL